MPALFRSGGLKVIELPMANTRYRKTYSVQWEKFSAVNSTENEVASPLNASARACSGCLTSSPALIMFRLKMVEPKNSDARSRMTTEPNRMGPIPIKKLPI